MHTLNHVMERQNELLRGLLASAVRTESLLVQKGQAQAEVLGGNAIDTQALVASLQACRYSFEDAASKLRMNLALQTHPDSHPLS